MADPNPNPTPDPNPNPIPDGKDVAYWQGEAKKAFQDRDAVKNKLRELEGRVLSDEDRQLFDTLKTQQEQAEEDRKKKAGEFDALRQQMAERHEKALKAERDKIAVETDLRAKAVADLHNTLIGLAFAGASEWFGDNGKTVLTPDIAQAYFGKHIVVKDEHGVRTVVVKDQHGNDLIDTKTGQPMPFDRAIGELIDALPAKDRILRGSGKAGSGSAGGSTTNPGPQDLDALIRRAGQGDADALAILRARRTASGLVQGSAWDKLKSATR
jgi:uncharacterized protein DUF6651